MILAKLCVNVFDMCDAICSIFSDMENVGGYDNFLVVYFSKKIK